MRLLIPGVPISVNHCYFTDAKGRRLLTTEGKAYVEQVAWQSKELRPAQEGMLIIKVWYWFPDHRRRDTHNMAKLLLDGLAKGLDVDDSWFLYQEHGKAVDKESPRVELEIETKKPQQLS